MILSGSAAVGLSARRNPADVEVEIDPRAGLAAAQDGGKLARAGRVRDASPAPSTEKPGGRALRFAEHPETSPYQQNLDKNPANYAPLTPFSFLERAADVYPGRTAVIHGRWRADYAELRRRCRRLASALAGRGVRPGDTVALMLPNVPAMLEAHYGIPMAGCGDQRAERPPRGRDHRLHPGARRGQGAADRPRVLGRDRGGARAARAQAAGGRRARDRVRGRRRAPGRS